MMPAHKLACGAYNKSLLELATAQGLTASISAATGQTDTAAVTQHQFHGHLSIAKALPRYIKQYGLLMMAITAECHIKQGNK